MADIHRALESCEGGSSQTMDICNAFRMSLFRDEEEESNPTTEPDESGQGQETFHGRLTEDEK